MDSPRVGMQQTTELLFEPYLCKKYDPDSRKYVDYNVKLVVYAGDTIDAEHLYPTNHKEKIDYHYLSFKDATHWLDMRIQSLESDIDQCNKDKLIMLFPFLQELYQTQIALLKHF